MGTATPTRTDEQIQRDVLEELQWDARVQPNEIEVRLPRAAERLVRRLAGARGVTNLIAVKPYARPLSSELKRKIEEALVRSAETDAQRITVEAQGNKVILRGKVRSWAERQEAERMAWSAPGVTEVENDIMIEP